MTATAQPTTQGEPDPRPRPPINGSDATSFGDLVRFQARDGVFLRAEHLAVMQTYAAELAQAVGLAAGTGVVYGFRPEIAADHTSVEVGPGLAIDPTGRPLQATEAKAVVRFLDAPLQNTDGFWVVEIARTTLPFGTEKIFGNVCDDPCSTSALQPWVAEGVVARLRPDSLEGFAGVPSDQKRSWLASTYFERTRQRSQPWLVPAAPNAVIASITGRDWTDVARAPEGTWVPLGVVWRDGDTPRLDMWTARREIFGRFGDDLWRSRLAMRPWNAFLAQLLQFQDQLSDLPEGWAAALPGEAAPVDPLREPVAAFVQAVSDTPVRTWKDFKQLLAAFEATSGHPVSLAAGKPLRELGFVELPPAGLLPAPQGEDPEAVIRGWLEDIDVRFGRCRADFVPFAIEQARDLDRIPLRPGSTQPHVDVLLPHLPADLDPLVVDSYGWVAFVRRRDVQYSVEPDPTDTVEVRYHRAALKATIEAYERGEPPETSEVQTVTYPRDSWQYPGEQAAGSIELDPAEDVEVIAVARSEQRRPLAVLRASLLFAALVQEPNSSGGRPVRQVHAVVPDSTIDREIIAVVQPPSESPNG